MGARITMQEHVARRTESQLAMPLPRVSKELDGPWMGLSPQSMAHHAQLLELGQHKSVPRQGKWYGTLL